MAMKWTDLISNIPDFVNFPKDIMDLLLWMGLNSVQSITELDESAVDRIRVPFWWLKSYYDNFSVHPGQANFSDLCSGSDIFRLPFGAKHEISVLRKYFLDIQTPQSKCEITPKVKRRFFNYNFMFFCFFITRSKEENKSQT